MNDRTPRTAEQIAEVAALGRVAGLSVGAVLGTLARVIAAVEIHGAPDPVVAVLAQANLLAAAPPEPEPAPPDVIRFPGLARVEDATPGPEPAPPVVPPVAPPADEADLVADEIGPGGPIPPGTPEPLAAILRCPLPEERGRIRGDARKARAVQIRYLFKTLGLKGIGVTTPDYSMASSNDVKVPRAADHDTSWQTGHDFATCPHCQARTRAIAHLGHIIVSAFPDMDDRSDTQSDYYDNPVHVH